MLRTLCRTIALLAVASLTAHAATTNLGTASERSGFRKTGRYDEVITLCHEFEKTWPQQVRCINFGTTPEGRPMLALVASRSGALTATAAHERKLPVLLSQGGIHAGEIDGKDAGLLLLRELLENRVGKGTLEKVVWVFVPVFNIDGHERMGRWNRPNQRGPEEMGWRTTAQNINLNRDYMKADAPEMVAMLKLINEWDPIVYTDLHVTDGAQFEHDVSIQIEPIHAGDAGLRDAGRALQNDLLEKLRKQGSLPLPFYPSFVINDDPTSGFADVVAPPRFSTSYPMLRNRFGMLVETHSWKDYATRVRVTRNTLLDLIELSAERGAGWLDIAQAADTRAAQLGGSSVPLDYKASDKAHMIAFRGYAYTRTPSAISGALMTHYDEKKPQIWNIPLRDDVQPILSVTAPVGGYLVPSAYADDVARKLDAHGVEYQRLSHALPHWATETFRADKHTIEATSFENRTRMTLEGNWKAEPRDVPAGSLFVPIAQSRARLAMGLLEPQAPDSLVAWGWFNGAFEQKEYMEEYVAEQIAREQMAKDANLAAEFNQRLATDPAFAKDPAARLQFFAKRHSSWDERLNLYPVMRTAQRPD
ncbi:MAG: M14 family metallopeptidase [Tahibacter sp.]